MHQCHPLGVLGCTFFTSAEPFPGEETGRKPMACHNVRERVKGAAARKILS